MVVECSSGLLVNYACLLVVPCSWRFESGYAMQEPEF